MAYIYECKIEVHSVIDNLDQSGLPEGEPEVSDVCSDGFIKAEEGALTLSYVEIGEGTRVSCDVIIDGEAVTIKRRGDVVFDVTLSEGKTVSTVYSVPPYSFDTTVRCRRIRQAMTNRGGSLSLLYSMNIGGQEKSVRMTILAVPKAEA